MLGVDLWIEDGAARRRVDLVLWFLIFFCNLVFKIQINKKNSLGIEISTTLTKHEGKHFILID
jgi:hypothetical protein